MRSAFWILLISTLAVIAGCDQDPFRAGYRKLAGDYELHQWEDGKTYYLEDRAAAAADGGGVAAGTIDQIGWNAQFIVVSRQPTFVGDKSGWLIIDLQKKTARGPYTREELDARIELRDIKIREVGETWSQLGR